MKANSKRTSKKGDPDPSILKDVVNRIVRAASPERIVLFGSAARGTMGTDSDLDMLVIKAGKFNRHRVTTAIYRELSGEIAVDAMVVTPEEVERYRDVDCLVISSALREGKVVYEANPSASQRSPRMDPAGKKQPRALSKHHSRR